MITVIHHEFPLIIFHNFPMILSMDTVLTASNIDHQKDCHDGQELNFVKLKLLFK